MSRGLSNICILIATGLLVWTCDIAAQITPAPASRGLQIEILEERGNAVPGAQVTVTGAIEDVRACVTNATGYCAFSGLVTRTYRIRAEKRGFYPATVEAKLPGPAVQITLTAVQHTSANVEVIGAASPLDVEQTSSTEALTQVQVQNIPYPTTRDIRNILPFIPGVVQDGSGQAHVAGGSVYQSLNLLDGLEISQPVTGTLNVRVSPDAVSSLAVEQSRYSAEFGRASAGLVSFGTATAADHLHFDGASPFPSFQFKRGLDLYTWTPRAIITGPLINGRLNFLDAAEFEYDNNIVEDLPAGGDRIPVLRGSNLAKLNAKLTSTNSATAAVLFNRFHLDNSGLSPTAPLESTTTEDETDFTAYANDQQLIGRYLLESGVAVSESTGSSQPKGTLPYLLGPNGATGNYFRDANSDTWRVQARVNLLTPSFSAAGQHSLKFGADVSRIFFSESLIRRPIQIVRQDGTRESLITYSDGEHPSINNTEFSWYGTDRWSINERFVIESGMRWDRDAITNRNLFSPRVATSWMVAPVTKLTAGVGLFYDATNLLLLVRPRAGLRLETRYAEDGTTIVGGPFVTAFHAPSASLRAPRFVNWSIGLERQFGRATYAQVEFLSRRGRDGLAYVNLSNAEFTGNYLLGNIRRDRYEALQISARRLLGNGHELFASYVRSAARSNAVLDFSLDWPIISSQAGGPLPWDAPDRVLSWGWVRVPRTQRWDFSYTLDWRTGYPFTAVDNSLRVVGAPNSLRFPRYFSFSPYIERRFVVLQREIAIRLGVENVTNHRNPFTVNNNIDSPGFGTFGDFATRYIAARLRLIGHK